MNAARPALAVLGHGRDAPAARSAAQPVGHIPSLDGLRAVSFLFVFLGHSRLFGNVIPGGYGVTVFFFLSGFLITTLLRAEYAKNRRIDFRKFWIRRTLRILPPLYVVLVGVTVGALIFDPPGTLMIGALAARALQYTNYWIIWHGDVGGPPGTGVYWSLAVEEHFYVLFPLLYVAMQRCRLSQARQASVLFALCILVMIWRYVLVEWLRAPVDRTYLASDTRVDGILFGCILAVWRNPVLDEFQLSERLWKYLVVPAAIGLSVLCLAIRSEAFRETARYSLQGLALLFIFVAAIRFPRWAPFRVLNWRPLAYVGVLSYSLYLMHYSVINLVMRVLPATAPSIQVPTELCVSLGLAWMIHVYVEKPCARWRKTLAGG